MKIRNLKQSNPFKHMSIVRCPECKCDKLKYVDENNLQCTRCLNVFSWANANTKKRLY